LFHRISRGFLLINRYKRPKHPADQLSLSLPCYFFAPFCPNGVFFSVSSIANAWLRRLDQNHGTPDRKHYMAKKKITSKTKAKPANKVKQLDETGNRKSEDRRQVSLAVKAERRKGHRRRQIDPTTCEREYSEPEIEFMHALDEYKRLSGRMFPTCSEILEVLHKMGYRQVAEPQDLYNSNTDTKSTEEFDEVDSEEQFA
jgi:hypothetical protein